MVYYLKCLGSCLLMAILCVHNGIAQQQTGQTFNCYQCYGGDACLEPTKDLIATCEDSIGCITIYDTNSSTVARDCMRADALDTMNLEVGCQYIDSAEGPDGLSLGSYCFCNSSECNSIPFKLHAIPDLSCYVCGGADGSADDLESCSGSSHRQIKCPQGANFGCMTFIPNSPDEADINAVQAFKGCAPNPLGFMSSYSCRTIDDQFGFAGADQLPSGVFCLCETPGCNFGGKDTEEIPDLQCYQCVDCERPYPKLRAACGEDERYGCMTAYDGSTGEVDRACVGPEAYAFFEDNLCLEIPWDGKDDDDNAKNKTHQYACLCKDSGCNNYDFSSTRPIPNLHCYQCMGDGCEDITSERTTSTLCPAGANFGCLTTVNYVDNTVVRSCAAADSQIPTSGCSHFKVPEELVDAEMCVCHDSNCNRKNPLAGFKCYQCVNCPELHGEPTLCSLEFSDACYKVANERNGNKVARGCAGPGPVRGSAYTINDDLGITGTTYYCDTSECNGAVPATAPALTFGLLLLLGRML